MKSFDFYDIDESEHDLWRGVARLAPRGSGPGWLMVYFRCCHTYGRINRNAGRTAYVGRCPRCGAQVQARIGAGGTAQRLFEAQ